MKEISFFPIERNRYFYGKLLTVRDFEAEQDYQALKRRLTNRVIHGAGVVCGLGVTASDDQALIIESGMALDYLGREIVIEEPLIRKLEMIEGEELLHGAESAYLCLQYSESDREPVNAVGADGGSSQFNMTREGYRLFFSRETPDLSRILSAGGHENVRVIYSSELLALVLSVQAAACAGDEIGLSVLVIKNDKTMPVHFTLEGESSIVESENGRVLLAYNESPEQTENVTDCSFALRAQNLANIQAPLFPNGVELNVEVGGHKYKNFISIDADIFLCATAQQLQSHRRRADSLEKHLGGGDLPIYLAKLELVNASEKVFLGTVTPLPFGQERRAAEAHGGGALDALSFTASAQSLEFWQKPDVRASFNPSSGGVHLDFGIPTPEVYDYMTSHGSVEIVMPGGIKVNARYLSEEIPHGLGPGNVEVTLATEFIEDGADALVFGNSEVFRSKGMPVSPPWLETAAVVYPERGTMQIGVWLHDNVPGNLVRVHYYVQKPERDTKRMLENRRVGIQIIPEVCRIARREQMRLKAIIQGSEDKGVTWTVKDENGGAIDKNGIYQAPETPGTYEITARASADDKVTASAFVIVE